MFIEKCADWSSIDYGGQRAVKCEAPATHDRNCDGYAPVCAEHTCRCSVTLAEAERRRERQVVPSSWLAL